MNTEDSGAEEQQELTGEQRLQEQMLRLRADFENYRQRTARDLERQASHDKEELIKRLLPIADDLRYALDSIPGDDGPARRGFAMVEQKFSAILAAEGVERIGAPGEEFDPALHEAVSVRESDDGEEGKVQEVLRPGYRMGDVVLRPARVSVAVRRAE